MLVSRAGTSGGPFFVHIEGLPNNYTWKDLKDLIRNRATHGVWAEMQRPTVAGVGYARVNIPDEALQLYHWLANSRVENRALTVHLWDIAPFASPFPPGPPGPQAPALVSNGPHLPQSPQQMVAARYQLGNSLQHQAYLMQVQSAAPPPFCTAAGIRVNATNGTLRTESRGVYVSGLHYSAGDKVIKQWFSQVGRILDFRLNIDIATRKSKGNCTIQYGSTAEARRAIDKFNNTKFMEKKLLVRFDKSERPTMEPAQPERVVRSAGSPTIVDGSTSYTRHIMASCIPAKR
ncbi:hypothetical protein CERZMDRAFT_95468 [Cercospora zeae-maydis SCOH1-5]|uniref:RRM domain-containing protein n=1 Tax=Cercospora zeae-maydis SCOH1-5 TaxID=717836 RepID=A0A6A6FL68_9PEZI|nr:hypothetical protein CERZMDRAFT_95468 [Cercospora zeae-maydis SCOH1-5]